MSLPPPPGIYVPTVLFFHEDEALDIPTIKAHILRLAQVDLVVSLLFSQPHASRPA